MRVKGTTLGRAFGASVLCPLLLGATQSAPDAVRLPEDWATLPAMREVWVAEHAYVLQTAEVVVLWDFKNKELHGRDLVTGAPRWTAPAPTNGIPYRQYLLDADRRVLHDLGQGERTAAHVFDFGSGRPVWTRPLAEGEFVRGSGGNHVVIFQSIEDRQLVLDAATGEVVRTLPREMGLSLGVAEGILFLQGHRDRTRFLSAYEIATGKTLWTVEDPGIDWDAYLWSFGDQVVAAGKKNTVSFDPRTGRVHSTWGPSSHNRSRPAPPRFSRDGTRMTTALGIGLAWAGSEPPRPDDRSARVLSLDPLVIRVGHGTEAEIRGVDPATDAVLWRKKLPGTSIRGEVELGELVLVQIADDPVQPRVIVALDAATGAVRWHRATPGGGRLTATLGEDRLLLTGTGTQVLSVKDVDPPARKAKSVDAELDERLSALLDAPVTGLRRPGDAWFEQHAPRRTRGRLLARLATLPPERAARVTALLDPARHPEDRKRLLAAVNALLGKPEWPDHEPQELVAAIESLSPETLGKAVWARVLARVVRAVADWRAGPGPANEDETARRARGARTRSLLAAARFVRTHGPDPAPLDAALLATRRPLPLEAQVLEGPDPDGDGLTTPFERLIGTDPEEPDTDGDGLTDGRDPSPTCAPAVPSETGPDAAVLVEEALTAAFGFQIDSGLVVLDTTPGVCPSLTAVSATVLTLGPDAYERLEAHGIAHGHGGFRLATVMQIIEAADPRGKPEFADHLVEWVRHLQAEHRVSDSNVRWVTVSDGSHGAGRSTHFVVARVRGRWRVLASTMGRMWIA